MAGGAGVSRARATRGLRRPSLDARNPRHPAPPACESEGMNGRRRFSPAYLRCTKTHRLLRRWCSMDARSSSYPTPPPAESINSSQVRPLFDCDDAALTCVS